MNILPARFPRLRIRRSIAIVLLGAVCVLTLVGFELPAILGSFGRLWVVSDQLEPADAVVVLGGGSQSRPNAAARLYDARLVRLILVPTVEPSPAGIAEPENPDRETLIKLGVPASAIIEFGNDPSNTYEEARDLALWLKQNRVQRIIVPTELFPSRRVRWILQRELGKVGVRVMIEIVASHVYDIDIDHWWQSSGGRSNFLNEIIKYLYYRIRYWRS
jgi:uncharacterized SAM-binding protein YcdF (DUF218 family)